MGCLLGSAVVQLCDPGQTTHSLGLTFSLARMDVEHKYVSIRNELEQVTLPGGVREGFTGEATFGLDFEG